MKSGTGRRGVLAIVSKYCAGVPLCAFTEEPRFERSRGAGVFGNLSDRHDLGDFQPRPEILDRLLNAIAYFAQYHATRPLDFNVATW